MATYRKRPVEIEAWPVRELTRAAARDWSALPKQVADAYERGDLLFPVGDDRRPFVRIKTLEGLMDGLPDDWIICGVQSELYPCKPDIFAATYDVPDARASDRGLVGAQPETDSVGALRQRAPETREGQS